MVFCFDQYYPCGGMEDFKGSFDDFEEATAFAGKQEFDYCQVWDRDKLELIWFN